MVNDIYRILIETIVKNTLKDIKDSPERSTRKLVNMALEFSGGRFQHDFFTMAQTMLENEDSSYYALIKDGVAHIDTEHLLHFGMNIGYNSFTAGAKQIRKKESDCRYNIPWTIFIQLDEKRLTNKSDDYDSVITQGEDLGIYTWLLYDQGNLMNTLPLIQNHPDCAFILFCKPKDITSTFLDAIGNVHHLMLAVCYEENIQEICKDFRQRQLLYSLYYVYGEKDTTDILNGQLFYCAQQMHPLFTAVIPEANYSEEAGKKVYGAITDARNKQIFQTVAWDVYYDGCYIDSIISDDACSARFDAEGILYAHWKEKTTLNLFEQPLTDILKQAFPKKVETP